MQHFLTIDWTSVRILLTGASGFLGRALLHQLLKENHQILAIARNPLLVEYPSVYWKSADLNQPSTYQEQLSEFSPEALIHLAWQDIPNFSLSTLSVKPAALPQSIQNSFRIGELSKNSGSRKLLGIEQTTGRMPRV